MKQLIATSLLILAGLGSMAQNYSSRSKSAIRRFEKARVCYAQLDTDCAHEQLQKALRSDPEFVEALQLLAQVCYDLGDIGEAAEHYERSLQLAPGEYPDGYRNLARLTMLTGDYARSLEHIETFLKFPPEQVRNRPEGLVIQRNCLFALEAMQHPVPFHPENLGDSVNSEYNEYWPRLSVDDSLLMFTVMDPHEEGTPGPRGSALVQEDLYFSRRSGSGWGKRANAGPPLNSMDNEGAHTMTADGKILYFTACNRRDGLGQCDIYRSERVRDQWSVPVNIGAPVNSRYSDKHPAVSADGRRLYFTSDRPGGKGSFDIWVSTWSGDHWGQPVNLGDSINTPWMEQSPFIHPDQQSLYFSSNGWPGMGQGDLYISRVTATGEWSAPENLGYPVNTYNDEIGLTVNASGERAFFASDRDSGKDTDLFTFEMPVSARPVPVSYMKGRVYDSVTGAGLASRMQLIELESGMVVMEAGTSGPGGNFLISLPTDRSYMFNVTAEGYLFYSEHFDFSGLYTKLEPFLRDIPMNRISEGHRVVLKNIFFDVDSDALKPESIRELEKLAAFLREHPELLVEIGGHTDNTGTELYNRELSEKRAAAVVAYLTSTGIGVEKIRAKGYGDTEPVGDNTTEEGRAANRRTEFKILKISDN